MKKKDKYLNEYFEYILCVRVHTLVLIGWNVKCALIVALMIYHYCFLRPGQRLQNAPYTPALAEESHPNHQQIHNFDVLNNPQTYFVIYAMIHIIWMYTFFVF